MVDAPNRGPGPEEEALIARLQAGEEAAYEELVRRQAGRLLSVTRRLLRNEEDARDALQETFLAAFRSIGRFGGASRLSTWLHRIAVNAALMRLRAGRARPEESIEELLPRFAEDGHFAEAPAPWPEDAHEQLARGERAARVRAAIDRLPSPYRNVLLLRDIEELNTEEAAEALGATKNAVKVRLHRARQALRALLTRELEESDR